MTARGQYTLGGANRLSNVEPSQGTWSRRLTPHPNPIGINRRLFFSQLTGHARGNQVHQNR